MPRMTALHSLPWRTWHNTFTMPLRYAVCLCLYLKKFYPLPPPPPPPPRKLYNHLEWGELGDFSLVTYMKVACVKVKSVQHSHLLSCSLDLIFPELMSASWKSLSRERCNVSGRIYQQGIPVCLPGRIQIWNRWMQRYDRRASSFNGI